MAIVLELPDFLKDLADGLRAVVELVTQQRTSCTGGRAVDYAKVEENVANAVAKVERDAHRACLSALDIDAPSVVVDGVRYSRAGRFPGTYYTLAGAVEVERTVYRRRGEPTFDAIGLRAGVVADGWLPRTARAMAHEVQKATSREAEASARENLRLPYSRSSFERVAHAVGEHYVERHQPSVPTYVRHGLPGSSV